MSKRQRHLESLRDRVRRAASGQRELLCTAMPAPSDLGSFVGTHKMWQRQTTDPDFARVRVATVPERRPVAVSLKAVSRIALCGPREPVLDLARAMLAHLVTFHHPRALRVACRSGAAQAVDWQWLTWLPHTTGTAPHLVVVLDDPELSLVDGRHGVTILDLTGRPAVGTACAARLELVTDGERLSMHTGAGVVPIGHPDRMALAQAESVALQLSAV